MMHPSRDGRHARPYCRQACLLPRFNQIDHFPSDRGQPPRRGLGPGRMEFFERSALCHHTCPGPALPEVPDFKRPYISRRHGPGVAADIYESKSEFAIGFYKMVEAHGVGGMSPVSSSSMAEWVRTADALRTSRPGELVGPAEGTRNARYVTFQRGQRQCLAFVHNGPMVNGQVNWILGAAFCRELGIAYSV